MRFVLFVGAGKTAARNTILKLNLSAEQHLESTVDPIERERVEFTGVKYSTKTSTYEFVEAPSHHSYVHNMMSRALQAHIGVLFVSVAGDGIPKTLKDIQLKECADMVMELGITKFLLVITKMDENRPKRCLLVKNRMVSLLEELGGHELKCISVSFEAEENINSQRRRESDPCFFDALDAIELTDYDRDYHRRTSPTGDGLNLIKSLVRVDLHLDGNRKDAMYWYERAIILEKISNSTKYQPSDNLDNKTQKEWGLVEAAKVSNYKALLEAAKDAAKFQSPLCEKEEDGAVQLPFPKKEEDSAVPCIVQGYQCWDEKKYEEACKHFVLAIELVKKKTAQLKNRNNFVIELEAILENITKELEESKEKSGSTSYKKSDVEVKPRKEGKDIMSTSTGEKRSLVVDKKRDKAFFVKN